MKHNFEEFFTMISKGIMLKYGLWALTGLQLRLTYRVCYFVRLTTISYISKENTSKAIFYPTIDIKSKLMFLVQCIKIIYCVGEISS